MRFTKETLKRMLVESDRLTGADRILARATVREYVVTLLPAEFTEALKIVDDPHLLGYLLSIGLRKPYYDLFIADLSRRRK